MSLTSCAISGWRDQTTSVKHVSWMVTCLVTNCASTCANHNEGSVGQKGGSFKLTAPTADKGASADAPWWTSSSDVASTDMITRDHVRITNIENRVIDFYSPLKVDDCPV